MILLIDNYDSFTYNIYQAFYRFGFPIKVVRSDKISIEEIRELNPQYIIIGPGPKTPKEAGISIQIVQEFQGVYPILGICLGHQAIMAAFGMEIVNAKISHTARLSRYIIMARGFLGILVRSRLLCAITRL